ncbi:hypothetical protein [Aquimarina sp. AU474]|uniref:hypothetical protein n=1 Tax=Aquimarina sp. AU474 TaxID=2108529 RepID=UPI000D688B69|nr:hypothetical protein [Aquimarina sp. AU474]
MNTTNTSNDSIKEDEIENSSTSEVGTILSATAQNNISKDCKITNSTDANAKIILPTTAQTNTSESLVEAYNQSIEILALKNGGQIINKGNDGTVTLDQTYTDPSTGQSTYSTIYNLLISTSDWFYPIANNIVEVANNSYPDQTVNSTNQTAMTEASSFYQTISVYPTSKLATDFEKAMKSGISSAQAQANGNPGSSQNIAQTLNDAVNTFFQSTKNYRHVTMSDFMAIDTYYKKFPFVWSKYSKAVTYYLYSSDGKTKQFIGTITLNKPSQINIASNNGGYTCTFSPAKNPNDLKSVDVDTTDTKALTYLNGIFVDDVNKDIPGIAVKGIFQLRNLFSNDPKDVEVIPVLTGTINGITCLGRDESQTTKDNPKSFKQIIDLILEIGAGIVFIPATIVLIRTYYLWIRDRNVPTTRQELDALEGRLNNQLNDELNDLYADLTAGRMSPPSSISDGLSSLSSSQDSLMSVSSLRDLSSSQSILADRLGVLDRYASSFSSEQSIEMQELGTRLSDLSAEVNFDSPPPSLSDLSSLTSSFGSLSIDISDLTSSVSSGISEHDLRSLDDMRSETSSIISDVSASVKDDSELSEDSDPESDGIFPIEE